MGRVREWEKEKKRKLELVCKMKKTWKEKIRNKKIIKTSMVVVHTCVSNICQAEEGTQFKYSLDLILNSVIHWVA